MVAKGTSKILAYYRKCRPGGLSKSLEGFAVEMFSGARFLSQQRRYLRGSHVSCFDNCLCCCHTRKSIKSPSLPRLWLGQLVIEYSSTNKLRPVCDMTGCRKTRKTVVIIECWPPWGLLDEGFVSCFSLKPQRMIQLSTFKLPILSWAGAFEASLRGDIETLKYLFKVRLASPHDVNRDNGLSLLQVSQSIWN